MTTEPRRDAPSAWRIEQAMSTWMSARARLLAEDADLAGDEAALAALLGTEEGDVLEVLARLLRGARHAESMADAAAQMLATLKARHDRYQRRDDYMRGAAFAIMQTLEISRHEWPDMTVNLQAGRVGVEITSEAAVPDEYCDTKRTPRKKDLLAEIKRRNELRTVLIAQAEAAGIEVDPDMLPEPVSGCELRQGMPSLVIRTR